MNCKAAEGSDFKERAEEGGKFFTLNLLSNSRPRKIEKKKVGKSAFVVILKDDDSQERHIFLI